MLFKIVDKSIAKVSKITLAEIGWQESDLEKIIFDNIREVVSDDLMVIFKERKMQEEPDIIALDKQGNMVIFELKRWSGKQENLLQVLRYGQLYGQSNFEDLTIMYKKINKNGDLYADFCKYFDIPLNLFCIDNFNKNQRFVIITNGVDNDTLNAIEYWNSLGLQIEAIPYWVYKDGKITYIEFNTDDKIQNETGSYIVNTNKTNDINSHNEMLKNKVVAAFCIGWKEKIVRLQKDDTVFLYESGKGIVAVGKADGKLIKSEYRGILDDKYSMKLSHFELLKKPISAQIIKEIIGSSLPWQQTLYAISDEKSSKLLTYIKNNC